MYSMKNIDTESQAPAIQDNEDKYLIPEDLK